MAKKNINEGDEYKIYFDKPEVTGNEAFISIMNDYNSDDPARMKAAREAACQQMERIIIKMISQKYSTYAKRYGGELKQAGFVGVLTGLAVERSKRYNPYDKYTPSAFFYKYIKHEICEFINSQGPAKTSSHYSSSLKKVRQAIEVYTKRDEQYDETTIAQYTNISLDTVKVCFDILNAEQGSMSYNDLVSGDGGEAALGLNYETPEKTIEESQRDEAIHTALEKALTKDERFVIMNRFGFNGTPKTCNAIAQELGISENAVKKLQKKALEKLRGTNLRQWHANDAVNSGIGTSGIFTFFPESSGNDLDVQFTSLLSDMTFNNEDEEKNIG